MRLVEYTVDVELPALHHWMRSDDPRASVMAAEKTTRPWLGQAKPGFKATGRPVARIS